MKSIVFKRASVAALSLTLGASLLAGCASKSGDAQSPSSQTPTGKTSASQPAASAEAKADPFGKQPEMTVLTRGLKIVPGTKFPDGQNNDDNSYTRALKEKYNIQLENAFTAPDTGNGYKQKVDLVIASGKLPDYMTGLTLEQYKAVVKAGLAMDISKVWDEYASPDVKAVYDSNKKLFDSLVKTKDGKMYAIPSSNPLPDFLTVMWIRQDWLDKLGLKAPTNMDELQAVAKAFIEKDPDGDGKADTAGIVGPGKDVHLYQDMDNTNFNFNFDPIFASYNAFPGFWVKGSDGKAVYGSILPETKTALQKLADMYKQGLISPGILSSNTYELVNNNKAGLFFGTWWDPYTDINNSWKNDKNVNWKAYLLPSGSDGIYNAKAGNAAQGFTVISKDAKHPEAVIKMLNIFKNGLEKLVDPKDHDIIGDGWFNGYQTYSLADGPAIDAKTVQQYYADGKEFKTNDATKVIIASKTKPYSNNNFSGYDFSGDKANNFGTVISFGIGLQPYLSGKFRWVNTLSYEKTPTMQQRWSNLSTLEYSTFSKIIVGQLPIDAFDSFVNQWKQEGGDKITKEIQASLAQ